VISDESICRLVDEHFDFKPASIIEQLELRHPVFRQVAAYGHFGRSDLNLSWERTDRAGLLNEAAKKI